MELPVAFVAVAPHPYAATKSSFIRPSVSPITPPPAHCPTERRALKRPPPSAKSTLEPSYPVPPSANVPPSLASTTVYHSIPSVPEHLSGDDDDDKLAHANDGDGYILAVSFGEAVWVRGRFVRTKPYFIESKQKRRIFRGLYGTSGATGLDAPVKPKASSSKGIIQFLTSNNQPRILSFGIRSLPYALNVDNLVTRGQTMFNQVLTDAEELTKDRATELCLPPFMLRDGEDGGALVGVNFGISKNKAGKIIGGFVTEKKENQVVKRYPMIYLPGNCDVVSMGASEHFIVLVAYKIKEESGGLFSSILGTGKTKQAPMIDMKQGSILYFFSRASKQTASFNIPDCLITSITDIEKSSESGISLNAIQLSSDDKDTTYRLSTTADLKSGEIYRNSDNKTSTAYTSTMNKYNFQVSEQRNKLTVNLSNDSSGTPLPYFEENDSLMVLDFASSSTSNYYVCSIYDKQSRTYGLLRSNDSEFNSSVSWFSSDENEQFTGMSIDPTGEYCSVLSTNSQLLIFSLETLNQGPVETVQLDADKFGHLGYSVGSIWTDYECKWSEEGSKPVKSSYEIFDARNWNDIESGFTSLGV